MLAICNESVTVALLRVSICVFDADKCLIAILLLMLFHVFLRSLKFFFRELLRTILFAFLSLVLKGDFCNFFVVGVLHFS